MLALLGAAALAPAGTVRRADDHELVVQVGRDERALPEDAAGDVDAGRVRGVVVWVSSARCRPLRHRGGDVAEGRGHGGRLRGGGGAVVGVLGRGGCGCRGRMGSGGGLGR